VMWNWRSNVLSADSYTDMVNRPYNYTWYGRGDRMYFYDSVTNYLWIRMIISDTQVDDPIGNGDGAWVTVEMNVGSGAMSCTPTGVADVVDTIRTLPVLAPAPAPPVFSAEQTKTPRDDAASCAVINPNCIVSAWTSYSPCQGTCNATVVVQGTQDRSRSVTAQPQVGGAACPDLTETRSCSIPTCGTNRDCTYTDWVSQSVCKNCDDSVNQTRTIVDSAFGQGIPCGAVSRELSCCMVLPECSSASFKGYSVIDVTALLAFLSAIFALF